MGDIPYKKYIDTHRGCIAHCFSPLVLVLCPPELDEYFQERTGMSVAHFLQWYSRRFSRIRFVNETDIAQVPPLSRIFEIRQQLIQRVSPDDPNRDKILHFDFDNYGDCSVENEQEIAFLFKKFPDPTPWFYDWCSALYSRIPCNHITTVSSPSAVLFVVPAELDSTANATADSLWGKSGPPSVFRTKQFMSDDIRRFGLVVATGLDNKTVDDQTLMRKKMELQRAVSISPDSTFSMYLRGLLSPPPMASEARSVFSITDSSLLEKTGPVGSGSGGASEDVDPLATSGPSPETNAATPLKVLYKTQTDETVGSEKMQKVLLRDLPKEDMNRLREFVQDFIGPAVISTLTEAEKFFQASIAQSKKGFSSRMKSLFGKEKQHSEPSVVQPPYVGLPNGYPMSRRLADVLLLTRQYAKAQKQLQQCLSEVKNDKSALALLTEMTNFCAFMGMSEPTQFDSPAELFHLGRDKQGELRCKTMSACAYLIQGKPHEASKRFEDASKLVTDRVAQALLLEQAAFSLLLVPEPPLRRVCAFLIAASQKYAMLEHQVSFDRPTFCAPQQPTPLVHHAYRCLRLAYPLFQNKNMGSSDDWMRLELSRQAIILGNHQESEMFLRSLIDGNALSETGHGTILRNFLTILEEQQSNSVLATYNNLPEMPFPVVHQESLKMRVNDDPPNCKEFNGCVFEQTKWKSALEQLKRVAYSGEYVEVEVVLSNPLCIPIQLCSVHTIWNFTPKQKQEGEQEKAHYTTDMYDVVLAPKDKLKVVLKTQMLDEGTMQISGIAFNAFGKAWGQKRFSFLPPGVGGGQGAGNKRKSGIVLRPDVVEVEGPMPRMKVSIMGIPNVAVCGQLCNCSIIIKNDSPCPATGLKLGFSHPAFFTFDKEAGKDLIQRGIKIQDERENMGIGLSDIMDNDGSGGSHDLITRMMNEDALSTLTWVNINDLVLGPGETLTVPFHFRPFVASTGGRSSVFHTALAFKSENTARSCVRLVHSHNECLVVAFDNLKFDVISNPINVDGMTLNLSIESVPSKPIVKEVDGKSISLEGPQIGTMHIDQISCLSRRWKIALLSPDLRRVIQFDIEPKECLKIPFRLDIHDAAEVKCQDKDHINYLLESTQTYVSEEYESPIDGEEDSINDDDDKKIDLKSGVIGSLLVSECDWRWEEGEMGHTPKTLRNNTKQKAERDNAPAFGLGFSAMPTFADAYTRIDEGEGVRRRPDLDIIAVNWTTCLATDPDRPIHGFTLSFRRASESVPVSTSLPHTKVCLSLAASRKVFNDFQDNPICNVPVSISVRNFSTTKDALVRFDTLLPDDTEESELSRIVLRKGKENNGFFWTGLNTFSFATPLKPLESRTLRAIASVLEPGLYNFNSLKVFVKSKKDDSDEETEREFRLADIDCIVEVQQL